MDEAQYECTVVGTSPQDEAQRLKQLFEEQLEEKKNEILELEKQLEINSREQKTLVQTHQQKIEKLTSELNLEKDANALLAE